MLAKLPSLRRITEGLIAIWTKLIDTLPTVILLTLCEQLLDSGRAVRDNGHHNDGAGGVESIRRGDKQRNPSHGSYAGQNPNNRSP